MFAKYLELKDADFDILGDDQNELAHHNIDFHQMKPEKINIDETDVIFDKEKTILQSQSSKTKGGCFQISFEEGFMNEHLSAFRKNTQNLMEQSLNFLNSEQINFGSSELFKAKMNKGELNILNISFMSPPQRTQFLKDLQTQQKFMEFLKLLQSQVPKQILHELAYLSYLAWERYIEIRKSSLGRNELLKAAIELAEELSNQEFEGGRIQFLNFEQGNKKLLKNDEELQANFENYLEFFCSTIFLIVEEYFQNPYSEENDIKRQRSYCSFEWEEELGMSFPSENSLGMPVKRFKLE